MTNEEWSERYGSIKKLHTGPNGENPAPAATDPADEDAQDASEAVRSPRSAAAAESAIADALGTTAGSEAMEGIDVAGLDAPTNPDGVEGKLTTEAEDAAAAGDAKKAELKARLAAGKAAAKAAREAAKAES